MADQKFANNVSTTTTALVSVGAVSITVLSATDFPDVSGATTFCLATLHNVDYSLWEVVKVNSIAGNVLSVERAHEGTVKEWPVGTYVSINVTKKTLETLQTTIDTNTTDIGVLESDLASLEYEVSANPGGAPRTRSFVVTVGLEEGWDSNIPGALYFNIENGSINGATAATVRHSAVNSPINFGYSLDDITSVQVYRNGIYQPWGDASVWANKGTYGEENFVSYGGHKWVRFVPALTVGETLTFIASKKSAINSISYLPVKSYMTLGFHPVLGDNPYCPNDSSFTWATHVKTGLATTWTAGAVGCGGTSDGTYGRFYGGNTTGQYRRVTYSTVAWANYTAVSTSASWSGSVTDGSSYSYTSRQSYNTCWKTTHSTDTQANMTATWPTSISGSGDGVSDINFVAGYMFYNTGTTARQITYATEALVNFTVTATSTHVNHTLDTNKCYSVDRDNSYVYDFVLGTGFTSSALTRVFPVIYNFTRPGYTLHQSCCDGAVYIVGPGWKFTVLATSVYMFPYDWHKVKTAFTGTTSIGTAFDEFGGRHGFGGVATDNWKASP